MHCITHTHTLGRADRLPILNRTHAKSVALPLQRNDGGHINVPNGNVHAKPLGWLWLISGFWHNSSFRSPKKRNFNLSTNVRRIYGKSGDALTACCAIANAIGNRMHRIASSSSPCASSARLRCPQLSMSKKRMNGKYIFHVSFNFFYCLLCSLGGSLPCVSHSRVAALPKVKKVCYSTLNDGLIVSREQRKFNESHRGIRNGCKCTWIRTWYVQ